MNSYRDTTCNQLSSIIYVNSNTPQLGVGPPSIQMEEPNVTVACKSCLTRMHHEVNRLNGVNGGEIPHPVNAYRLHEKTEDERRAIEETLCGNVGMLINHAGRSTKISGITTLMTLLIPIAGGREFVQMN
jgi:hypothetical protein